MKTYLNRALSMVPFSCVAFLVGISVKTGDYDRAALYFCFFLVVAGIWFDDRNVARTASSFVTPTNYARPKIVIKNAGYDS